MSLATRGLSRIFSGLGDPMVATLGLAVTMNYGTLYYAHAVLAPAVSADFGITLDRFFMWLSLGLLAGGLVAPFAGKATDHFGARAVMITGSLVAASSFAILAQANSEPMLAAGLIIAETAACMVFYETAFAGIAQAKGRDARRFITALTLIAGFASTIFWPLTQALLDHAGWRGACLLFAVTHLLVCLPLQATALKGKRKAVTDPAATPDQPVPVIERVHVGRERTRAFVLLAGMAAVSGFAFAAVPVHMIVILTGEGIDARQAAIAAMVMGPVQFVARVLEIGFGTRIDPIATGRIALGALIIAVAVLLATTGGMASAVAFAVFYGVAQGLITIARGTIALQLFGLDGYGAIVGRITGLRFFVNAFAPFAFAYIYTRHGLDAALWCALATALAAMVLMLMIKRP